MSEQSEPPAPGVERARKAKPDLPPKTRSAVLIDADYVIRNDETRVRLQFKAKSVFYLYDRYEPYFYLDAPASEIPELMKANAFHRGLTIHPMRIEEVEREVEGHRRKVLKVYAKHPPEVPDLRAAYKDRKAWEYNIPFGRRYMIDLGLGPLTRIRYERKGRRIIKILSKKDASTAFKILAFDIETYNPHGVPRPERDECIMISYATGLDAKEGHVHTWRDAGGKDFCHVAKDEKGMIEAFGDDVAREDPDILAGYNSTQFDLPYMEARAKATKASLRLGRDGSSFSIRRRGIRDIAKIRGRIYVDVLPLLRFLSFIGAIKRPNNFTLDATASELLGKKKGDVERLDIWQMWDDPAQRGKLAEYSRTDSHLTWELARLVLPLELEMAKITYLPLNDVVGATASQLVESLLMHEAVARHALVPNKPGDDVAKSRLENPIEGAYVKTPSPGIYENMVVFDFRGLYPSIIISHNIDPFTLNCSCCTKAESHVSPTGARFCSKKHGLIPDVLAKVIKARGELKDKLKTLAPESDEYRSMFARQQSLKILANSYYGYLAFSRSRYYSREAAESVTAWGRHYITKTIENAQKDGYDVIYSDTDSIMMLMGKMKPEDTMKWMKKVNSELPGNMELELEAFYPRGMFVSKKTLGGKDTGAKKKYALIDEKGRIKIRGFELVRRDWSVVARDTQRRVLEAILKDGSKDKAIAIVRETVEKLRSGKMDLEKLAIQTQLTKDLDKYEVKSPELAAALKADKRGKGEKFAKGSIVRYVITRSGTGSNDGEIDKSSKGTHTRSKNSKVTVSEKAELLEYAKDYDADYYIDHQVIPTVLKILKELGVSEDDLKVKGKQSGLGSYF
ncbi:MAG: DNA-directed DNA polymerase [Candidatus Micrarchaeota archaeon]